MDCPKCHRPQRDEALQCEACGIYFAKFKQQQAALEHSVRRAITMPAPARSGWSPAAVLGVVAATALIFGVWAHHAGSRAIRAAALPVSPRSAPVAVNNDLSTPVPVDSGAPKLSGLAAQLAQNAPPHNAIEQARNATVLITTGWSTGSGFIVDAACHVITNRHVVESDGRRVASSLLGETEVQNQISDTQRKLTNAIAQARRDRRALALQPGTNAEQLQLDDNIAAMETQLDSLSSSQISASISDRVQRSARSGFKVTLIDGTSYDALHAQYADSADLALFQLPADHCPFISAGQSAALAQGEKLFGIGSPQGLSYTVTSGIFSSARSLNGALYLQTDTPINPGNSGGPLLTERGEVVGVNTMMMRNAEGIGFAIPIEIVYQQFAELR